MSIPRSVRAACVSTVAAIALLCVDVSAAPPDVEAAAQVLFEEGMALMDAGNYAEACPKLQQAQDLDPGMANQFRLGECYERLGKLASAWRNFTEVADAARAAGMKGREEQARERADALRGRLSMLIIKVPDEAAKVPGIEVRRNGEPVEPDAWGAKLPVDGGTVKVEASAPGREPWAVEVQVADEGVAVTVKVEPLPKPGSEPGPGAGPGPGPGGGPPGPGGGAPGAGPGADRPSGMSGQAIAGIVIGSVGIVAMGVGVGVGMAAGSSYDDSEAHCVDNFCTQEGLDIRDSARTQADVGTIVFVVGAAALVGGAVLWLTAPSGDDSEPAMAARTGLRFGVTPGGLTMGGAW